MEWINEKAKTLSQGAIRAMFDRANKMTDVISLGIGEPDMTTPKEICDAAKQALDLGSRPIFIVSTILLPSNVFHPLSLSIYNFFY